MTDVLGRAVIEIGVDELRLQDELGQAQKDMSSSFNETLKRTKITTSEMSKMAKITGTLQYLDVNRVKLADAQTRSTLKAAKATQFHYDVLKKLNAETFRTRFGSINDSPDPSGNRNVKALRKALGYAERGIGLAGGVASAGVGLTFAGAAAAGSTTLDTLTGSIKKLTLALGAKTQNDVLNLSKRIQEFGNSVASTSKTDLYAGGGLLTGAVLGYRYGGMKGVPIGAGLGLAAGLGTSGHPILGGTMAGASLGAMAFGLPGAIGGGAVGAGYGALTSTKFKGDYTQDLATNLANNPDKIAKALTAAAKLDRQAQSQELGTLEWFFANDDPAARTKGAAKMLRDAVAQAESIRAGEGFKTSGLNMPASYAGLSDVRQQAQLALFSKGPLEMANFVKELELNRKALESNTAEVKKKGGTDPNGVAPPMN